MVNNYYDKKIKILHTAFLYHTDLTLSNIITLFISLADTATVKIPFSFQNDKIHT